MKTFMRNYLKVRFIFKKIIPDKIYKSFSENYYIRQEQKIINSSFINKVRERKLIKGKWFFRYE
jgi:hypothetical protein